MSANRCEPLTEDRLQEMIELTSKAGPANCWTGTTGELSTMIRELMAEREQLLQLVEHHQREAWNRGLVSAGFGRHDIFKKGKTR